MNSDTWKMLGGVAPTALTEARLQAHWAAQIVSAAGSARIPTRADFSHTNLGWSDALQALRTHAIGDAGLTVALVPATLEVLVLGGGKTIEALALPGKSVAKGLRWLESILDRELGDSVELSLLAHEMPAHPLADGGVFSSPTPGLEEVARWFHNTHEAISTVEQREGTAASPTRCWPHHFDLATLVTVEANEDPELARSIGVGMSPGDGSYDQPYFYVNPWPAPEAGALPVLSEGTWHTDGWTGIVLPGENLLAAVGDQSLYLARFLEHAVTACRGIPPKAS